MNENSQYKENFMSLEKLSTEIRKEQIAQAALALIATQGLRGLNMADLAKRTGLVPSALYRHFKSKDEILDSILGHIKGMLDRNVQEVREEASDSLEQIKRLLFRHIRIIRENQAILRVVFSEEIFSGPSPRKRKVYAMVTGYLRKIAEIVREGQTEKKIRADLEPGTIAMQFLGIIQPAAILWQMSGGALDVTKHAERAWKFLSQAIRVEQESSKVN